MSASNWSTGRPCGRLAMAAMRSGKPVTGAKSRAAAISRRSGRLAGRMPAMTQSVRGIRCARKSSARGHQASQQRRMNVLVAVSQERGAVVGSGSKEATPISRA